jgi:anti-anti-sigma factor
MNVATAKLSICVTSQAVFLQVDGPANFNSSPNFKRVILELAQKGRVQFVIDLRKCPMMDSTFLGVLIGLVVKGPPAGWTAPWPQLALYQPSQRVLGLFDNLGVGSHFKIADQIELPAESFAPVAPAEATPSKLEQTITSYEAHQALMEVNPDNVPKFKDVVQFLAEDIKKMEGGK